MKKYAIQHWQLLELNIPGVVKVPDSNEYSIELEPEKFGDFLHSLLENYDVMVRRFDDGKIMVFLDVKGWRFRQR